MSERRIELRIDASKARLDKFLAEQVPELSRSEIQRLIASGQVSGG